jgi:hypothetical protein
LLEHETEGFVAHHTPPLLEHETEGFVAHHHLPLNTHHPWTTTTLRRSNGRPPTPRMHHLSFRHPPFDNLCTCHQPPLVPGQDSIGVGVRPLFFWVLFSYYLFMFFTGAIPFSSCRTVMRWKGIPLLIIIPRTTSSERDHLLVSFVAHCLSALWEHDETPLWCSTPSCTFEQRGDTCIGVFSLLVVFLHLRSTFSCFIEFFMYLFNF